MSFQPIIIRLSGILKILDTFIQKAKKQYKDSRTQRNLSKLNEDLNDVTRIMTRNIQDVLGREDQLKRKYFFDRDRAKQVRNAGLVQPYSSRFTKATQRRQTLKFASAV
jgi:hypothetical protein